ncbi:MAG TPA: 30S ribosomal protein S12 methylthiotransferase RimO, partial [Cytophagaceae bacterium]|nr:30S ribosomal protein S12 methylthiotransferase RimO [Cytophagaceae bacterium]
SQRYKDDLEKEIPQVDAFFGTNELPALLKKFKADYKHELLGERQTTTPKHYAFLKIAEGCDRPCSFCAIPVMRGKHVSRPADELVKEAANLAKNGTKELVLIAQDLTFYGLDLSGKRDLAELLRKLSDVAGIDWIRLQYAYPSQFPLDVLDVMNERSNICKYLDIPLQHATTEMLKIMRRGITQERTEELLYTIREKVPGIALRTTLIAGHPGETEAEYEKLYRFVEKQRFDRLGVFTYSHEEQTHAYSMDDSIPMEVKKERADNIMALQEGISQELNQLKIDKTFKVLVDRKEGGFFVGRTEQDSPEVDNEVLIDAKNNYVRIGDFAMVKIYDATEFDLYGNVVKD